MQRIEAFKNSMPRDELLRLGDEVVSEMQPTIEGQFMLTEVMMADQMDRLIIKRLRLRTYAKWRQQYLTLRAAQRDRDALLDAARRGMAAQIGNDRTRLARLRVCVR